MDLAGGHCFALLDSGSDLNVVDARLVDLRNLQEGRLEVKLATQNVRAGTLGITTFRFRLKQIGFETVFYVVRDLGHQMILGVPWLCEQKVNLDFERECMNFGRHERGTIFWSQGQSYDSENINLPEIEDEVFLRKQNNS